MFKGMRSIYIKRLISAVLVLSFLMIEVVLAYSDYIAVKADESVVYQNISADAVIRSFDANGKNAYSGKCRAVVGLITGVSGDGRSFTLKAAEDESEKTIACTSTFSLYSMVSHSLFDSQSQEQPLFKVLGKFSSSGDELSMTVDRVYISDGLVSEELWSVKSDTEEDICYDTNKTLNRGIADVMHYEIPSEWARVEEKLPNVDGYQYRLNLLDGSAVPESLFIFYVDNKHLKNIADKEKTEKFNDAIVRDIRGPGTIVNSTYDIIDDIKDFLFDHEIVRREVTTDYAKLIYYDSDFKDNNNNEHSQHRVEFIFLPRPNSETGPQCVLYVYPIGGPSETHRADILYVLRSMFM